MHVEQVVQIPFFQGLPAEALRQVAADSTVLALERGRILMAQHDAAEHLFFLISGVVQFYILSTNMKTFLTTLAVILVVSSVIGMGTQGALYEGAEDLISYMNAWNKECGGKTDPDCSRNLAALRKTAYQNAEWIQELFEQTDNNNHWLIYVQLFKYHGDCFNRYDTQGCKDEWAAFVKEKSRIETLYGPEPRWSHFPDALKSRRPPGNKQIDE